MKTKFKSSLFIIFCFITLFGCKKDEESINVCGEEECTNNFIVPFEIDSNGYYQANLYFNPYNGSARFNIDIISSLPQIEYVHHYTLVKGNITISEVLGLDVIQAKRLYHDENGFTRCIVGPVLREHVGDTLIAYIDTYYEYNNGYLYNDYQLKFVIDSIR